jgi:uncharacterized protein (TIGR02594 family)
MKKSILLLFLLCACANVKEIIPDRTEEPEYLIIADLYVGFNERRNREPLKKFLGVDPVNYEWCAAFVNAALRSRGIAGSESVSENPLLARSFLDWGEKVQEPQIGDVIVFPRGYEGWQGHVGFYYLTAVVDGVEYYAILGGNQNDEVSYELYPSSDAIGIRRPTVYQ